MKREKTGGRKKGSKNIHQSESKKIIESFCLDNYKKMQEYFDVLDAKEKLTFLYKFSEFNISKGEQTVELNDAQINFIIQELRSQLHGQ